MNKKKTLAVAFITTGIAAFAATGVMASTKIGSVTGKDGDVKDLLSVNATVNEVNGSHVTFSDSESGKEYEGSFGPSWYSGSYIAGQEVNLEMVETDGENDNGHNAQVLKVDETTLRDTFEGKPLWAGSKGSNGSGTETRGMGNGSNFADQNGDGVCDNME